MAQYISNGSFAGVIGVNPPDGWRSCFLESSSDIQPGVWGVTLPAYEGDTYMGLVCRGSGTINENSCEEIGQVISQPLEVGVCYQIEVFLAYSDIHDFTFFLNPINLRISGGGTECVDDMELANFGPVNHTDWQAYSAFFIPEMELSYISLEAIYSTLPEYFGNIMIDQLDIREISSPALDLGPDRIVCNSEMVLLDVSQSNVTYLWQDGSTGSSLSITDSGIYWVEMTNVCGSISDTIEIIFSDAAPEIYLGIDTVLCDGDVLRLDAAAGNVDYLWQDSSDTQFLDVSQSGIYWVEVSNACGSDVDSIIIAFLSPPFLDLGADTIICLGESITLYAPMENEMSYLWSTGSEAPFLEIFTEGECSLQMSNVCGSVTDTISIQFENCTCSLFFPNTFTPNQDQINDSFIPLSSCFLQDFHLAIYNRWGEMVFESYDANIEWDGTMNGDHLSTGVYSFMCTYQFSSQQSKQTFGTITLLR
jgi:gliding motility-associated-like protein